VRAVGRLIMRKMVNSQRPTAWVGMEKREGGGKRSAGQRKKPIHPPTPLHDSIHPSSTRRKQTSTLSASSPSLICKLNTMQHRPLGEFDKLSPLWEGVMMGERRV